MNAEYLRAEYLQNSLTYWEKIYLAEEQARMHQERELEPRSWAEQIDEMWKKAQLGQLKQIALAKSIKAAVETQRQENVDAADSTRDQSSEDQGPVAQFAIDDGEMVCAKAPQATSSTRHPVGHNRSSRFSALTPIASPTERMPNPCTSPRANGCSRIHAARHQYHCTPTGLICCTVELSARCATLTRNSKGFAQPRRDRPKQPRIRGHGCRLIDNTYQNSSRALKAHSRISTTQQPLFALNPVSQDAYQGQYHQPKSSPSWTYSIRLTLSVLIGTCD